jgi:hypothetical protein
MKPIVFLGPSLPWKEAESLLDADYRPPVKRGDLPLLPAGVRVIGIIDGVFLGDASVGHREILALLRAGVRVIGGSSMGALRAAELSGLGMEGVGTIYEWFASGKIEGDDEVALVFDPDTLEPLSEPLVNMRWNLERAARKRLISARSRDLLMDRMRSTYFPHRNVAALLRGAEEGLDRTEADRLREYADKDYVDIKRRDAVEVLAAVKRAVSGNIDVPGKGGPLKRH